MSASRPPAIVSGFAPEQHRMQQANQRQFLRNESAPRPTRAPIPLTDSTSTRDRQPFGERTRSWFIVVPLLVAQLLVAAFLVMAALSANTAGAADPAEKIDTPAPPEHARKLAAGLKIFKQHVRPILVERCVGCHGGDTVESKFSLATRKGLLRGGGKGTAVVVGPKQNIVFDRAADSRLYRMLTRDEKPFMPFEEDKLSDEDIGHIGSWIDHGAPYDAPLIEDAEPDTSWTGLTIDEGARDFWSFRPLTDVPIPQVEQSELCLTPVDNFILANLSERGLTLNPAANRQKLIRRAAFDLTGLPPSPEQIASFVNDPAPDAYERLIEALLTSPHFGERWGRHWLDLARFAESHGFEHDYDRPSAYHYRDFVIHALNNDLPFDTFVKWQLAGDELSPGENLAMMATGYLAAGVHSTQITANEVEKHRYDELDDMLATTGTAMLGLTIGCARCHDHKFDPIPQRDYYRLLSAFTSTVRSEVELNFDQQGYSKAKSAYDKQHAPLLAARDRYERESLPATFEKWEASRKPEDLPKWIVLNLKGNKSAKGAKFTQLPDGSLLVSGKNEKSDTYTLIAETELTGVIGIRLGALADPSLPKNGPGRAKNGNFALSDLQITAAPADAAGQKDEVDQKNAAEKKNEDRKSATVQLNLTNPRATFAQEGLPVSATIDGDTKSGWAVDGQIGKDHAAAFAVENPPQFTGPTTLTFTLKFNNNAGHQLGRLRISVTTEPGDPQLDARPATLAEYRSLRTAKNQRNEEQQAAARAWFRPLDPEWSILNAAVTRHARKEPQPEVVKVLVSSEGLPAVRLHSQGADFFEETYFLSRGDTNHKEGVASLGYLQVLMRTPESEQHWPAKPETDSRTSFRRAALAEWITDTHHGAGNLLARVIVNRLWQHHLGRGIVATPSDFGERGDRPTHPELLDWLAGELIANDWRLKPIHKLIMTSAVYQQSSAHDNHKATHDRENQLFWRFRRRRLEGEVIRDALLAVSGRLDGRMFGPGSLDSSHRRRSVYFTVKRSQLMPMMQVFDAPEPLSSQGQRSSTTIAPQALLLLNNPNIREDARDFARRLIPSDKQFSLPAAVRDAYRIAVGRDPDDIEQADAAAFIELQMQSHGADQSSDARLPALTDFCQVLICLNEFVYVD